MIFVRTAIGMFIYFATTAKKGSSYATANRGLFWVLHRDDDVIPLGSGKWLAEDQAVNKRGKSVHVHF